MTKQELVENIKRKASFLCVGLDPDLEKIPEHLLRTADPIFEFNKAIIDATHDLCVAYKPNTAFYEALGGSGWISLERTLAYIPDSHFIIADAKRGDIGNTSRKYAEAFFNTLNADAITVAPYMGKDSVAPFLDFDNKWVILLVLTSNASSQDFQFHTENGEKLYEKVLRTSLQWGTPDNLMFVVGATQSEYLQALRRLAPEHFLLVPGIGAQGGSLKAVAKVGLTKDVGLLVNSSRSIIYASHDRHFADAARKAAQHLQVEMAGLLKSIA